MVAKSSTAKSSSEAAAAAITRMDAKDAGLRYTSDTKPGIRRKRDGETFIYLDPSGKRIKKKETLSYIRKIVIPPAWEDVWISPYENGHIMATGRDAKGRKQYRYHSQWRSRRDENKFHHMLAFARALPKLRSQIKKDIKKPGLGREKIIATVVRLLEATLIRVGNDEYARRNKSYGLTTMHNRHVKIAGERVLFNFRGKSGVKHEINLQDRELARIIKKCQDMPGQELFSYLDDEGKAHDISSNDVNSYLRQITGSDFTAKDFRTWAGTVLAAMALQEFESITSQTQAKKNIVAAIEAVAKMLGNTPSVCRKCYVHPAILDSYLEGDTVSTIHQRIIPKITASIRQLKPEEAAVFVFLEKRLQTDQLKVRL